MGQRTPSGRAFAPRWAVTTAVAAVCTLLTLASHGAAATASSNNSTSNAYLIDALSASRPHTVDLFRQCESDTTQHWFAREPAYASSAYSHASLNALLIKSLRAFPE